MEGRSYMIVRNSVYKYVIPEREERIRIIEIIGEYVYIVSLDQHTSMPRKEAIDKIKEEIAAEKLILIKDPFIKIIDEKDLSALQIKKRNEDWEVIEKYWNKDNMKILEKETRNDTFVKIKEEENISIPKIKKMLSKFWQRGMNKNALLPDYINSGGKGKEKNLKDSKVGRRRRIDYYGSKIEGINITSDVKKHIELSLNKYYRNNNKITLKETYINMLADYYSDPYKEDGILKYKVWDKDRIPTYNQFYYWAKKYENIKIDIISRESQKEFDLKYRELLSNSKQETDGPGTRVQVDATIADIYLVSSLNRNRIIGRPIIYAIIDVYSRLIVGIYVGLEGPSWLGAMMALDNMISDKVDFCKQYGIKISEEQWPCKHLPEIIIADRGEFEGYSVGNLINNLNVKIENTSPYRGDLKGIVERNFRTVNEKIKHKTPGAIQKEFRERGDKDYRLNATLTLEEFTQIYINIVLNHNNKLIDKYPMEKEMIEDEISPTPINLWNWGIKNRKGRLRVVDRDILRLNILPKGKANVSRAGIRFKGLYYSSEKAIREQWFINNKVRYIEIIYDPRNMSKIYIPSSNGFSYDECNLTDVSIEYKECILEEIIFNKELESELRDRDLREQNQNSIDLEKEIEAIVKNAKKKKSKVIDYSTSSNKKLKHIRHNRTVEKETNRKIESFDLSKDNEKTKIAQIINNNLKEESKNGNDKLMELIKKKWGDKNEE